MSKNQFTGTATQPQCNRKFCQFNKEQYCKRPTVHFKIFLAITFLFNVISSWNLHDMCQRFFMYSETEFHLDPTKDIEFPPYTPIVKFAHPDNVMFIDMTSKFAIFTMGFYGVISHFCQIRLTFRFWVYIKCWRTWPVNRFVLTM